MTRFDLRNLVAASRTMSGLITSDLSRLPCWDPLVTLGGLSAQPMAQYFFSGLFASFFGRPPHSARLQSTCARATGLQRAQWRAPCWGVFVACGAPPLVTNFFFCERKPCSGLFADCLGALVWPNCQRWGALLWQMRNLFVTVGHPAVTSTTWVPCHAF